MRAGDDDIDAALDALHAEETSVSITVDPLILFPNPHLLVICSNVCRLNHESNATTLPLLQVEKALSPSECGVLREHADAHVSACGTVDAMDGEGECQVGPLPGGETSNFDWLSVMCAVCSRTENCYNPPGPDVDACSP